MMKNIYLGFFTLRLSLWHDICCIFIVEFCGLGIKLLECFLRPFGSLNKHLKLILII